MMGALARRPSLRLDAAIARAEVAVLTVVVVVALTRRTRALRPVLRRAEDARCRALARLARAGTDVVLRGERAIGLASSNYVLAQAQGAPAAMSFDIPPVPFFNHAYMLKRAAHPKSARLFMEWSATAEGQTAIASAGLSPIMDIDHPSALKRFLPAGVTPMSSADLADFANKTKEYTDILTEKFPG